jgi:esterase
MKLAHELITAPGASPTRAVLFLHGILGSGSNLRSHARRFVQQVPACAGVLVDLRAHGSSLGLEGRDDLAACARDLDETVASLPLPVSGVVGHSFGGKVALTWARTHPGLRDVMTLDSAPGPRPDQHGSESTLQVLGLLRAAQRPWPSRDAFVAHVEAQGLAKSLGQWLAMNLELRAEGWVFRLELPRIQALLEDYFDADLWPVIEQAAARKAGTRFHLVIGTRSTVYDHEDRVRAHALEASADGFVTVDLLEAGHWVHVEDPQGVSAVLLRRLGP